MATLVSPWCVAGRTRAPAEGAVGQPCVAIRYPDVGGMVPVHVSTDHSAAIRLGGASAHLAQTAAAMLPAGIFKSFRGSSTVVEVVAALPV